MVEWMSRRGMNLFVLAAKDEPSQRRYWRRPLEPREARELKRLVESGRRNSVDIAWALSPGLDLRSGDPAEIETALAKYESVLGLGVSKLVLAFDDLEPKGYHVDFANALISRLADRHSGLRMIFVPALYWRDSTPRRYWRDIARRLDSRYIIGWTGGQILSRRIGVGEAGDFKKELGHPLALGDNYPVQDRLLDSGRLFLGPLTGRDPSLAEHHEAYVANASPLPRLSRFALHTAAAYAADPRAYDPDRAWRESIDSPSEALRLFVENNSSSWLDPDGPEGSRRLEELLIRYREEKKEEPLRSYLRKLVVLPSGLSASLAHDPALLMELSPWVRKLSSQAEAALAGMDALARREESRIERFSALRRKAEAKAAITADLALDRFLNLLRARLEGGPEGDLKPLAARVREYCGSKSGSREALESSLKRLAAASEAVRAALPHPELLPWVPWLGNAASRAQGAINSSSFLPAPLEERLWHWRGRVEFISLGLSRGLMEGFLSSSESKWDPAKPPYRPPSLLRAGLLAQRLLSPRSFPTRLERALRHYEKDGSSEGLRRIFEELAGLPALARERLGGRMPEEGGPWLDKLGQYGRLGLLALEYSEQLRSGRAIDGPQRERWLLERERAASANGLEMCLELKNLLVEFVRWLRKPATLRPPFDPALPPNPAELF